MSLLPGWAPVGTLGTRNPVQDGGSNPLTSTQRILMLTWTFATQPHDESSPPAWDMVRGLIVTGHPEVFQDR
jgi:hypothetical protein